MNDMSPQHTQEPLLTPAQRLAAYEAPAVIYETTLEVRAGTPMGLPDPLDLLGAN